MLHITQLNFPIDNVLIIPSIQHLKRLSLAQSHLLNSQGKKLDTAKCLLNGSRELLAAWRTVQRVSFSNVCIKEMNLRIF